MHARDEAVRRLREALLPGNEDILVCSPLPEQRVEARFIGRFQGEEVVWDMQLFTLAQYERQFKLATDATCRGLMRIDPETDGVLPLQVAIHAPEIDLPTLRKVVIMMRNYKKLEFGLLVWSNAGEEG